METILSVFYNCSLTVFVLSPTVQVGELLKYSVKTYDFGELITIGRSNELIIKNTSWAVGAEISIPMDLDGVNLNRGGLLMIQNLYSNYDAGIYELSTGTPLRERKDIFFDNTLSTPNKINIKTNGDNVLTLKNNLSSFVSLTARVILLPKI